MARLAQRAPLPQNNRMPEPPSDRALPIGVTARTLEDGSSEHFLREEPLVIDVGGEPVLTMRTPGDDEHLALGFLLSEGIVGHPAAVTAFAFVDGDPERSLADTITVHVEASGLGPRGRLTRTHEIRSSCGLCGLANPEELLDDLPPLLPGVPRLELARIDELRRRFEALQLTFNSTGAAHAAALFGGDGALWGKGEDVGRHNALDKAIGSAARAGHDLARGIAMLSGRAGFDLVLKGLRLRIPIILSVSAASAQSYDLCRAAGATLVGFVRPGRVRVYLASSRLV